MSIAKIEPAGCCVHNGKVQLKIEFFLELDDLGYEEHCIQFPIIPPEGYLGELDILGNPIDIAHYNGWTESLPKRQKNNPFHNHFEYVNANIDDREIRKLLRDRLGEFLSIWNRTRDTLRNWKPKGQVILEDMLSENVERCKLRVADIINRAPEFSTTYKEN